MKFKIKRIGEDLYRVNILGNFSKILKVGKYEILISTSTHSRFGYNIAFISNPTIFDKKNLNIFFKYIKLFNAKGKDTTRKNLDIFFLKRKLSPKHKFQFKFKKL